MSFKSSELLKAEITRIEEEIGCGFVTKCITNSSPTESQKSTESPKMIPISLPKAKVCEKIDEQTDCVSPVVQVSEVTDIASRESFEANSFDEKMSEKFQLSDEDLLLSLHTLFSVQLQSEDEASSLVAIIELKDSLIKYYNVIPVIPKQLLPFIQPKIVTTDQKTDNYEVCAMDEC